MERNIHNNTERPEERERKKMRETEKGKQRIERKEEIQNEQTHKHTNKGGVMGGGEEIRVPSHIGKDITGLISIKAIIPI